MTPSKLHDLKNIQTCIKCVNFECISKYIIFQNEFCWGRNKTFKFKNHSPTFKLRWDWPRQFVIDNSTVQLLLKQKYHMNILEEDQSSFCPVLFTSRNINQDKIINNLFSFQSIAFKKYVSVNILLSPSPTPQISFSLQFKYTAQEFFRPFRILKVLTIFIFQKFSHQFFSLMLPT